MIWHYGMGSSRTAPPSKKSRGRAQQSKRTRHNRKK